tara:strand:- start:896 stop:1591 length:696 start_codon:yes stop_codon:yes gene_type:complete
MSENAEVNPVGESPQPPVEAQVADPEIQRLKAHNAQLIDEKQKVSAKFDAMQKQIRDLENLQSKQKQSKLEKQGEFESLWKEAQGTVADKEQRISELEQQLESERSATQQQSIKAKAVNAFSQAGVTQPEHMYALHQDRLRMNGNDLVVLNGGVQEPLNSFVDGLKSPDSQFAYMFASSGAKGMGAVGSTPSSIGGQENPYITRNFSAAVKLEAENPELAARFKAQAATSN